MKKTAPLPPPIENNKKSEGDLKKLKQKAPVEPPSGASYEKKATNEVFFKNCTFPPKFEIPWYFQYLQVLTWFLNFEFIIKFFNFSSFTLLLDRRPRTEKASRIPESSTRQTGGYEERSA